MDGVKGGDETPFQREGVRLDEGEGIVRLRVNINSNNLESSAAVPSRGPPGTTEKIKKLQLTSGAHPHDRIVRV